MLGSTPATQWYKLGPCGIKTHEVTVFCGGTKLAEFYSIADYSTTAPQIPILFAGGCWARHQLRNDMRDVPVVSEPMKLLSSVEVLSWQNFTRLQITSQPLDGFQFSLREVVGLNASYTPV